MDCKILFLFMINILCICGSPYMNDMSKRRQYCGRRLIDVMSLVCEGVYNTPSKKALNDILNYNNELDNKISNSLDSVLGYQVNQKPEDEITSVYRFRRGIVEDCCLRGCSYADLRLYCGGR